MRRFGQNLVRWIEQSLARRKKWRRSRKINSIARRSGRSTCARNQDMPLHVSNPPPKPLMIWDGDCHFCRRWIERWREITRDEVDYEISQKVGDRFPEIPREQF